MKKAPSPPPQAAADYYRTVADYYDREAVPFERHYRNNPILQRLREDFRHITAGYAFTSALEIGCGPGLDLVYWAGCFPGRRMVGIDVSPEMVGLAQEKTRSLANVRVRQATVQQLAAQESPAAFDLIYCYFGALNTEPDLSAVARDLARLLPVGGTLVLTFVNRWYWFDIVWNLLRLRPRRALARPLNRWPGYAPHRPLQSYCRSAAEIRRVFAPQFEVTRRRGYSILFPAWYREKFIATSGRLGEGLWRLDALLNRTPLWNTGEYSLYVLKRKK